MYKQVLFLFATLAVVFGQTSPYYVACDTSETFSATGSAGSLGCSSYEDDVTTSWTITGDSGEQLALTFTLLDTESFYDSVSVYDGPSSSSTLLGTFSGSEVPLPLSTTGNQAFVKFSSDVSIEYEGFRLQWAPLAQQADICFQPDHLETLTAVDGFFGCPYSYGDNVNITWVIEGDSSSTHIEIDWLSFSTEQNFDFVNVYAGDNIYTGNLIGSYSGTEIPPQTNAQGSVVVEFLSDVSNEGSGFSASYIMNDQSGSLIACTSNSTINIDAETTAQGTFGCSSYADSVDDSWLLTANPGDLIDLLFNSVNIEYSYDYIRVYDGDSNNAPLIGTITGTYSELSYSSSGTALFVEFTSDSSVVETGFSATYNVVQAASVIICSGDQSITLDASQGGTFGCSSYTNNAVISYTLTADAGQTIEIDFTSFDIENGDDFVKVYDGPGPSFPVLASETGNDLPQPVVSSGNSLFVVFSSDSSVYSGFEWQGTYGPASSASSTALHSCYTNSSLTVTTPGQLGCLGYSDNEESSWALEASGASEIILSFESFQTESGYDFVQVYDGTSSSATLLGSFSGDFIPAPVVSTGPNMYVVFSSDFSNTYAGFTAFWSPASGQLSSCETSQSISLTSSTGVFGCNGYGPSVDETYSITVASDKKIYLVLSNIDIETNFDYLQVYDGPNDSAPLIGTFTGDYYYSEAVQSSGNSLTVIFESDSSIEYSGFLGTYEEFQGDTAACDIDTTYNENTNSGILGCDGYLDSITVTWNLPSQPDGVLLTFTSFDLEEGYDFVTVTDTNGNQLGTFTGAEIPSPISSLANSGLSVVFTSDVSNTDPGFQAFWEPASV